MIKMLNCDCFDMLATIEDNSVDLLLTDPPYGMSFQSGHRKDKHMKIKNDDNLEWLPKWMSEINRVMKPDSHLYIFCSWHKVDIFKKEIEKYYTIKNLIVWHKNGGGMGDLKGGYGGVHELIFFINNGKKLNGRRDTDVINKAYRTGNENHPTEKPVNLMEYFIRKSSNPGDLVVDCFAGSFPVAFAAHNTGRRFIGSEIENKYWAEACKRMEYHKNTLLLL